MIEIDKSDTIVAGVSPAKVKESQPARLPLHLITESLLRAAYRAHPRFQSQDRDLAQCGASAASGLPDSLPTDPFAAIIHNESC